MPSIRFLVSPPVFAVGRFVVGAFTWAAPRQATRMLGLDLKGAPGMYWARLFGIRDVVLGAGLVLAEEGDDRRRWRVLAIATDAVDAVAGELAVRESGAKGAARWLLPGVAAATAALGVAGLLTDE